MTQRRFIGVVSGARSDYGIYRPVLRAIADDAALSLGLYVTGMHLSDRFGQTARLIEADGFAIAARVPVLEDDDSPRAIAAAMGRGVSGFAEAFAQRRPDLLLVLGDRFEMFAAALAAMPMKIPVAHLHGGERTAGAIDESLRHAMTKLSHLHLAACEVYARRIVQMGESPWRVHVTGSPAIDHLLQTPALDRAQWERELGAALPARFVLVAYHPVTLQHERVESQCAAVLAGLAAALGADTGALLVMPNADTSHRRIVEQFQAFARQHAPVHAVVNLPPRLYVNAMRHATAMLGNSSSGLIEAPSFGLPAVNVGDRQGGRVRGGNVLDVPDDAAAIERALRQALAPAWRQRLAGMANPYGDGRSSPRIVSLLRGVALDERLLIKDFHDLP